MSYGTISLEEQCSQLYGELATLYTTGAIRIWSSTVPHEGIWGDYPFHVIGYGTNGGADIMLAKGEPDTYSHTMGHQRPALYKLESYNKYCSSI